VDPFKPVHTVGRKPVFGLVRCLIKFLKHVEVGIRCHFFSVAGRGRLACRPPFVGSQINQYIQWDGAAQMTVDKTHAPINFRVFFKIIDETVFHVQPGHTDGEKDEQ